LSATPIPRTLYMSLLKVRDMSLLTTAPRERVPVQTIITDYQTQRVADAIRRELERGGQVFYLHNRVQDLDEVTYQLQQLVPEAIIESAHGQMDPVEMEDIMHRFIYEGVQVLVSTTIIENGIDIPNANTIIIDHAERFGLSQLYQLRGRVGRSDRQGYCYLMYPDETMLNDDAVKRLKVLSEHTELGSGFKVAMKDMEIRGAGNILGAEQSGQLEAIGLDLYMKILDEEINRQTQGEKSAPEREVFLELDYSGFIPDSYIKDASVKFEMYRKISSVRNEYQLEGLRSELEDRFGAIPAEVDNLLCIAQIKIICKRLEIYHLSESRGIVQLEFGHLAALNPDKIINLLKLSGGRVRMDASRMNYMRMQTDAVSLRDKAIFILDQLRRLE
ncbi:MAG: transcription-repair coupling factor, partial [Spirochaetales bacterium]|nr:transcription-repair coupling factor [Spirochaetales bacterium]